MTSQGGEPPLLTQQTGSGSRDQDSLRRGFGGGVEVMCHRRQPLLVHRYARFTANRPKRFSISLIAAIAASRDG